MIVSYHFPRPLFDLMLRTSSRLLKNPVIPNYGKGLFSHQLKRILNKKPLHYHKWTPIALYQPRPLWHADRRVDHVTGQEVSDPHWDRNAYWVPDQEFGRIPVPGDFKDAYWTREAQARRVQCPIEWMGHKMYSRQQRIRTDFQDLSFQPKKFFSHKEVLDHAAMRRR